MYGSTVALNSAASSACRMLLRKNMVTPNAIRVAIAMIRIRRAKPMVRPDCRISRLSETMLSRKLPPLVSPRSRRSSMRMLSRSVRSFDSISRRLMRLR